jgi:hypothetical protein
MNRVATVTAAKGGNKAKKRGPVRAISVTKAENGAVSDTDFEPSPDAKDEERYGPHLSERTVHTKLKGLLDHIKKHTASFFPAAAAAQGAPATPAAGAAEPDGDEDEEED